MKDRKQLLCVALLTFTQSFVSIVLADDTATKDSKIVWSCKKQYGNENILWLVEWGSKSYIKVFDERIPARYTMEGLDKRWDWGLDSSDYTYDYAISLSSDRTATYYEFKTSKDGTANPSGFYTCHK